MKLLFASAALTVSVADEPSEREQGLMGVTQLGVDEGMVFVYPEAAPRYFWMKDTPLPLSIAFVGADGRIVSISEMAPLSTALTPSRKPAMYAIEANQGWFSAHGVRVGDSVAGLPPASRQ